MQSLHGSESELLLSPYIEVGGYDGKGNGRSSFQSVQIIILLVETIIRIRQSFLISLSSCALLGGNE